MINDKYEKQDFQMILFIVKLFANVKHYSFYVKLSSGHLNMILYLLNYIFKSHYIYIYIYLFIIQSS